jgi:hypothetical protein
MVNEASYRRKLKTYPKFWYMNQSPFATLEDDFDMSDFNLYDVGPSGEVHDVQSTALAELKGGNTT